jgi:hypothetical protein
MSGGAACIFPCSCSSGTCTFDCWPWPDCRMGCRP